MVKTRDQIKKIAKQYALILQKKGISPNKIILYGSYAKNTPNKWSDLDFVVISPDLNKYSFLQRLILLSRATSGIKESIEAFGYTPEEISQDEMNISSLLDIAKKTGKTVYSK